MRLALVGAAAAAMVFSSAVCAQDNQFPLSTLISNLTGNSLPAGWSRNLDGSFKQSDSGVLCPKTFQGYTMDNLIGPSPDRPNILGVCVYTDGAGRTGAIRVRKYLEGWGDDEATAENDKKLMATDGTAPPMLMRTGISRRTGGGRVTVTVDRSGYLVDCSVTQLGHETPDRAFALYCSTLTNG